MGKTFSDYTPDERRALGMRGGNRRWEIDEKRKTLRTLAEEYGRSKIWIVKCDDGFFKYLLKTTFCMILTFTIVALVVVISKLLADAGEIIYLRYL